MRGKLSFIIVFITLSAGIVKGQSCQPVHTNYTSVPDTGVMLPGTLPHAKVGVAFVQNITIGIPSHRYYAPLKQDVKINWIKYNSLQNAQPGMTMLDNAGNTNYPEMSKGTWNCMIFEWTPAKAGKYVVDYSIDANVILVLFPVTEKNQTVGHFTVVVDDAAGISNNDLRRDYSSCKPNPFDDKTTITYYSEKEERSELKIFSITGQLVYSESLNTFQGKNEFSLDGSLLNKGMYFVSIMNSSNRSVIKLVRD